MLTHFEKSNPRILAMPGKTRIMTNEGKGAVEEAIKFLNAAKPIAALKWD